MLKHTGEMISIVAVLLGRRRGDRHNHETARLVAHPMDRSRRALRLEGGPTTKTIEVRGRLYTSSKLSCPPLTAVLRPL